MRWIIRAVMAIVILAVVAVASLFIIPTERIARLAATQFEAATGRVLTISGAVRPSIFPVLGVRAGGIEVGNPDWVDQGPMLAADRLHVGVQLGALFGGDIRVSRFEVDRPRVILVRRADGTASWDFGTAQAAAPAAEDTGGGLPALSFDLAEITDAEVLFLDAATGNEFRLGRVDAALRLPDPNGTATLEATGEINGARMSVNAEIDGLAPLLEGRLRPVDLGLEWDGGSAGFAGRVALSPAAEGALSFDATDPGPLMALAGQAAPTLPEGLGRDRISAAGDLTLASEGSLHLRNATITLDGNALTGELDVLPGQDRPMLRAGIRGGAVNLAGLMGDEGDDSAAPAGWSTARIDVSGLFSADADLALSLGAVDLGAAQLDSVELRARLDAGRMVVDLRQVAAYGGGVNGEVVVNGRGGLSMRGDLAMADVRLSPLLSAFADYDRLEGSGSGSVSVLAVGNDMATLMASLDGSGDIAFGEGAILGFDLWGMLRNFDTSFRGEGQRTVYDSLSASFTIENGVLSNDDLVLTAPLGAVTGEGTVDIGGRMLDYRVDPRVLAREDAAGIGVPLRISGSWSSPSFAPDLASLADQNLGEQLDTLQEQVRGQAGEALGIEVEEGQSVQDALEESLRLQAEDQLNRLLGGGRADPEAEGQEAPVTE